MTTTKLKLIPFLQTIFIFAQLEEEELAPLAQVCTLQELKKGTTLFEQGAAAAAFYIIVRGKLAIYRLSPTGAMQIIHLQSDGDIVAEAAIFDRQVYPASCLVQKEALLVKIPREGFASFVASRPQITFKILASYSRRLREFVSMVEYLSLDDVEARLIKYIEKSGYLENGRYLLELTCSKKELAGLLGMTPETLSRTLKKLKERQLLEEKDGQWLLLSTSS